MKSFRFTLLSISVVLFALTFSSCHQNKDVEKETISPVKTELVQKQSNDITISYPGKIVAQQDLNLSFRVAGPIAKIHVSPGEYVRQGDIIAEIDERDYRVQLSATEAEYTGIKAQAERVIELYKRKSATQSDFDKATYGLQQITAKYNAHKNALADTKMKAPCNGYVQKIYFSANETVSAGLPVISLIGSGNPQVEINLPAEDFIKREQFSNFFCTVDVYPNTLFPLTLIDIKKKANMNQLFTATFSLSPNKGITPYAGMSTTVYIVYSFSDSELVSVPLNSIFESDMRSFVWVVDRDNKVHKRLVTLMEIKRDGRVIITSGLSEGERVVTAGVHSINDGETVKILPNKSATNVGNLL